MHVNIKPNISFRQLSFSVTSLTRVRTCEKKGCLCDFSQSEICFFQIFSIPHERKNTSHKKRWRVIYRHLMGWKLNDFLHWTYFHRSRRKCRSSWTEQIIQQRACGDDGRELKAQLGCRESVLRSWHSKKPQKLEILRIWVRTWQNCGASKWICVHAMEATVS